MAGTHKASLNDKAIFLASTFYAFPLYVSYDPGKKFLRATPMAKMLASIGNAAQVRYNLSANDATSTLKIDRCSYRMLVNILIKIFLLINFIENLVALK